MHNSHGMLADQEIDQRLASTVIQAQKHLTACICTCFFVMQLVLTTHDGTHRDIGMLADQEIDQRLASTVFQAQKRLTACICSGFAVQLLLTRHVSTGILECWLIRRLSTDWPAACADNPCWPPTGTLECWLIRRLSGDWPAVS